MYSLHLLLLFWSLLSSFTVAAPVDPQGRGLRNANDIYTVVVKGDKYYVYTPYYRQKIRPVTILIIPNFRDQIIINTAYNANEKPHDDRSPRLHLSDIIQLVATEHANKPLTSINWVVAKTVVHKETNKLINDYYDGWKKAHPGASIPERLTINPSDPYWSSFKSTSFFKTANFAFEANKKTVVSLDLVLRQGILKDLWLRMGPSTST
ncbi:hypothetical protein LY76DRAFT_668002 [Colletotrichum caudatum]|nr:hypothetical protein LY76DRAFT_668002 [Colletotrichum caudatum]